MTRKLIQNPQLVETSSTPVAPIITHPVATMTHRMASVLDERRDPNFNTWTEIIPERVKEARGFVPEWNTLDS